VALTESATRLSDQADPVPDAICEDVAFHYDEAARAAIVISIAVINFWNRITVTTRQMARSTPERAS
jgi:alkylhydroperoxidase family enzyme